MSKKLLILAKKFTDQEVSADEFVSRFMQRWKQEGADGILLNDSPELSVGLSTIFCFADLYNPHDDRNDYELDPNTLKSKVQSVIDQLIS
ncbi:colicin immunity domain-containing protein [Lacunimicrobium album]